MIVECLGFVGVWGLFIVEGFFVKNVFYLEMFEVVILCLVYIIEGVVIGISIGVVLLVCEFCVEVL